ncbi:hypothetical protein GQ54DRAFT_341683 [Martensiomyces pterosporus]|nr:hypothetical protein GQ54DRAFT_341683 [Martensiomyces pterosporus]
MSALFRFPLYFFLVAAIYSSLSQYQKRTSSNEGQQHNVPTGIGLAALVTEAAESDLAKSDRLVGLGFAENKELLGHKDLCDKHAFGKEHLVSHAESLSLSGAANAIAADQICTTGSPITDNNRDSFETNVFLF